MLCFFADRKISKFDRFFADDDCNFIKNYGILDHIGK